MLRRLFVYGRLLEAGALARWSGQSGLRRRSLPARLPGWQRVRLRGTPFPTLWRGPGEVAGIWLLVPPAAFARLAAYEGPLYRLRPVRVLTGRGPRRAQAWTAGRRMADPLHPWLHENPPRSLDRARM